jgi:hypothetical protein
MLIARFVKCLVTAFMAGGLIPVGLAAPSVEPDLVVVWLTLLLRVQEVPCSILGPSDRLSCFRFLWFFSVPPVEYWNSSIKIKPRPLPTKSFSVHHSLITLSWTLYSLVTEKASLNKLSTFCEIRNGTCPLD